MSGLELAPLETTDADAYWRAHVAGRTDLPSPSFLVHMERYLRLPPEEQRTYFAFLEGGRIVGTVRLADAITFFSLVPEARDWTRDAVLLATEPFIAKGVEKVVASYDDSSSGAFTGLGFRETFSRMRMENRVVKGDKPALEMAHPEATDVDDIASFLMAAYEGHMEQAFGIHVGPPEEWRDYATSIWKGESGTYLPLASWLARDDAGLAAVSLATLWMGAPLVSEIAVRKDRRRQGLARALLAATTNALVDLGHDRLALYVTVGNDPAIRLYGDLGFRRAGGRTVSAVLDL